MAQNVKASAKPEDPTLQKKSNKKLLIGIILALVLVIAGGAGWFFTRGHDASQAPEVHVAPPKTPIFIALEPFTVNLKREASDQYLQLGLSFKIFDIENEAKLKTNLPEIRSKILQLLTTKTATELLTAEGKTRLIKEIMTMTNAVIGIVNTPVPQVVHVAPSVPPVETHGTEAGGHEAGTETAAATPPPVAPPTIVVMQPVEKKGVVDVLFTSFIIQ